MDENGKYGFINSSGLVVIPCKWAEPCLFFEDMAMVKDDNDKYGYIDKMGNIVIPCSGKSVSVSGAAWEQGKRYGQTGNETACNRERDGMSLNSNARPHKLGRAPLHLGAPALICWSGRPKPSFIPWNYLFSESRASGGFHAPSTDADVRPCRGCRDRLWQSRASVR